MQNQTGNTATSGTICPRGAEQYTWQSGDTLTSVSARRGITAQSLVNTNPDVNFDTIAAGTVVCIPPQIFSCLTGDLYEVVAGDTFQSIAAAFEISTLELQERNPNVMQSNLQIGQVLCVPKTAQEDDDTGSEDTGFSCPLGYDAKTVQEGQTYADLLIDSNVSYRAMRYANPDLIPGRLVAGTRFCAPPAGTRQVCGRTSKAYTILPGETLASLATKLGTTGGRLLQLNPTLVPSDFSSGTVICVP